MINNNNHDVALTKIEENRRARAKELDDVVLTIEHGPRSPLLDIIAQRPLTARMAYKILKLIDKDLPNMVTDITNVDGHYTPDKRTKKHRSISKRPYRMNMVIEYQPVSRRNNRRMNGYRGALPFESYGCIISAVELSRRVHHVMSSKMFHENCIMFLHSCGLLEYEIYEPRFKRSTSILRPYWYTRLQTTERGKRFVELFEYIEEMMKKLFDDVDGDVEEVESVGAVGAAVVSPMKNDK
jgi:hypothetical protein